MFENGKMTDINYIVAHIRRDIFQIAASDIPRLFSTPIDRHVDSADVVRRIW